MNEQEHILPLLEGKFSENLYTKLGWALGENKENVSLALSAIMPVLFGRIKNFMGRSDSMDHFVEMIRASKDLPEEGSSTEHLMSAGENPMLQSLLAMIAPERDDNLLSTVASVAHISEKSSSTLLSVGAGMLFSFIRKYLSNPSKDSHSLKGWLQDLGPETGAFGPVKAVSGLHQRVKEPAVKTKKRKFRWLFIALILLLLALAFLMLRGCSQSDKTMSATAQNSFHWKNLGEFFDQLLPDGSKINIPRLGVENKLVSFISNKEPVDNGLWFSFDRLQFQKNSALLDDISRDQLTNISKILKAYPNVKIKLGGFTDDSGADDFNMKLSQTRADSVKNELITSGIAADRISSVGFGAANPIAPNDTDDNRAKNRRIEIQVVQK
ncbi:OmpA family protein [Buttiauxella sp. B2]|uniref:OmpA family protein n=1 Tax=Buttiauxella sp. B2 TaxID=2587812 RepID=UPI0016742AA6|nr:OmpA family protein [Buttiauxella sp. B2]